MTWLFPGSIDDPTVAVTHLSEFDWRKTVLSIHNSDGKSNLLRFTELIEDERAYYLIMDQCLDSDFVNEILYKREISEDDARRFIRQLWQGPF